MIYYEGDPKLIDSQDGTDLSIISGQPEMDAGLWNAVYMSLFTDAGWWGNAISEQPGKFEASFDFGKTLTNKTRLDVEAFCTKALKWMLDEKIAEKITTEVTIPSVGMIGIVITIDQPGKVSTVRFQKNWAEFAARTGVS